MNQEVKKALHGIREAVDLYTKKLSTADYREVLEEVDADIDGRLDALADEEGAVGRSHVS